MRSSTILDDDFWSPCCVLRGLGISQILSSSRQGITGSMDLRSSCSSGVEDGISMGAENAMVSETGPLQNTQVIEESVVIVNLMQSEQKAFARLQTIGDHQLS